MKRDFVPTTNVRKFLEGIDLVEARGAAEKCLMVVDGLPGYGKTTCAEWYASQHLLPLIRAKAGWTPTWMLREILDQLQILPENSYEKMFRQATKALGERAAYARAAGTPYALVIDEVDHIVRSTKLMETIRDIAELIELPTILIGMAKVWSALERLPQIRSRVEAHVTFLGMMPEDTRSLIARRCDCAVAEDLCDTVHKLAGGYAREIMSAISAIERVGKRSGKAVTIADMAGIVLMHDRATGQPIVVRS